MKRLIIISALALCSLFMIYTGQSKALSSDPELCNWGKWAYTQGIELKDLVDTLNSIESMPHEDKTIVVACFVASTEDM